MLSAEREMTRDACNDQKFVQSIGLMIAWKSPHLNINRKYIKPEERGKEERYRILFLCRARLRKVR